MNTRLSVFVVTLLALFFGVAPLIATAAPVRLVQYAKGAVVRGPASEKKIALVFTGHEFAEGGDVILSELERCKARAAFFLTGDFLSNPAFAPLVKKMVAAGHYVGPHSDKHLLYFGWEKDAPMQVTQEGFCADLEANLRKIEGFGVLRRSLRWFLPPFEHYNETIAEWTLDAGLVLVNYTPGTRSNADYMLDGERGYVPSEKILESILEREKKDEKGLNGFLLLLHVGAGPGRTDKFHTRFGALLDELLRRGYSFATLDEMLGGRVVTRALSGGKNFVRCSQIGYRPEDVKTGIAFGEGEVAKSFRVVRAKDGQVVYEGTGVEKTEPWGRVKRHLECDFSSVREPGRYQLQVGEERSLPFTIGAAAYAELPGQMLEFMRQQRCGFNPWLDAECHTTDGRSAYGPLPAGTPVDASGGWHDAADLLKYMITSGNATAQMLLAWQVGGAEAGFLDECDARGKAGANGMADVLDEARWGLEWMLKMHPAPDQLMHQVADDRDHIGRRLPHKEIADYGWGKGGPRVAYFADGKPQGLKRYQSESNGLANIAGRYAAAMGLAYQIWKDDPKHSEFAQRCLRAGREVYALGRAKEGVQQGNSYSAPYRYEETTWADDMEWGAAELYRATKEKAFLDDACRYAAIAATDNWMGQEQVKHYQYYPFMNLGHYRLHGVADGAVRAKLEGYYREGLERCRKMGGANPYHIGVPFIWCSNNLTVALATQCCLYEAMTRDASYRGFAASQRDWLLGRNPWGFTMFTGVGAVNPTDPHLMTMQLTGRAVRGGLVDGPVYDRIFKSLKGVSITRPDPLADFQGPAVFHDDNHDYSTNEPTMDGTASAILLWALCAGQAKAAN